MDELFSFKERKTPIYIVPSVNKKTGDIVSYNIARDRFRQHVRNLIDNSPQAEFCFYDAFLAYVTKKIIGVFKKTKSQIFDVESANYIHPIQPKCFF